MSRFRVKSGQAGFTLLELVIVIAIIAGLAALLVPMIGGAREKAARAQDASNQADLTKQILSFVEMNHGDHPDKLDSLLEAAKSGTNFTGRSTGDTYGELYVTVGKMGPKRGIAVPFDLSESEADEGGSHAWDSTYSVGTIICHGLGKLGINHVVDHDPDATYPNESTSTSEDLVRALSSSTNDECHVAILNTTKPWPPSSTDPDDLPPYVVEIYDHYGLQLPVDTNGNLTGKAVDGDIVLLFGFGNKNTMVGNLNGGVQDAPFSVAFNPNDYYSRYLVMYLAPKKMRDKAKFLGVLGGNGYPVWKSHEKFVSAE